VKRLCKIGAGVAVFSILPILTWILLSKILGDDRIANVFSITYGLQFLYAIIKYLFGSGANVRKEKKNDVNSIYNGMLIGGIVTVVVFSLLIIFADRYILFFGQDPEFYLIYVRYGMGLIGAQTLLSFVVEKLYFDDKENVANMHLFGFNILAFGSAIILSMILPNTAKALYASLMMCVLYIVVLYIWQFRKFKLDFKFYENIRYVSSELTSAFFLLIIYIFGYRNAFSAGGEYILALNLVSLCTDTQWDMFEAIATATRVDIAKGRFKYRNMVKNAYIFCTLLVVSSVVMTAIMTVTSEVIFNLVVIYLVVQVIDMIRYTYVVILATYTQLEYSLTKNTIIKVFAELIRTILSVVIVSPFCTDIGQLASAGVLFLGYVILRISRYQVKDGVLTVKGRDEPVMNPQNA